MATSLRAASILLTLIFMLLRLKQTTGQSCCLNSTGCFTQRLKLHGFHGQQRPGLTFDQCKAACWADTSCRGLDWDHVNSQQIFCWLIFNDIQLASSEINHYSANRICSTTTRELSSTITTTKITPPISTSTTTTTTTTRTWPTTGFPTTTTSTTTATPTTTTTTTSRPTRVTPDGSSSEGTSFLVTFPPEPDAKNESLQLSVCTRSPDKVAVEVSSRDENTTFFKSVTVSVAECRTIKIPSSLRLTMTSTKKYLTVTASNLISVGVTTFGSCSSYTAIPESSLGNEYYIATLLPSNGDSSIVVITATEQGTEVTVSVRSSNATGTVSYEKRTTLNRGESYVLSEDSDLTGTRINSTGPVFVVAGNVNATGPTGLNYAVTQFPPTKTWGKRYVAASIPPGRPTSYTLKILSVNESVNLEFNNNNNNVYQTDKHSFEKDFDASHSVEVSAETPILVIQYPQPIPAAIVLPSADQYRNKYTLIRQDESLSEQYALLLMDSLNQTDVLVNGLSLSDRRMTGKTIQVDLSSYKSYDGTYVLVRPEKEQKFGVYVYAKSSSCAMGYPLAFGSEEELLEPSVKSEVAQAIRPAYIVLAGLGAGVLLLVIIAIILICNYPVADDEGQVMHKTKKSKKKSSARRQQQASVAYVDVDEHEMQENEQNHHHVESNPYYNASEDETVVVDEHRSSYHYDDDNDNKPHYIDDDDHRDDHHERLDDDDDDGYKPQGYHHMEEDAAQF